MIGVIVFFFQIFLLGFTSAQECKIPCQECKEIFPPMPQEYVGNWSLADPSSRYCPPETPCLYQAQNKNSWMCFCDPGKILYQDTCIGNCPNCTTNYTQPFDLTRNNELAQYNLECSEGYVLNGFNLLQSTILPGKFYYKYYCCKFNQRFTDTIDTTRTTWKPNADNVTDLTKQNVKCNDSNAVIKGYQLISHLGSNTISYKVICSRTATELSCLENPRTTSKGGIKVTDLVDLEVRCNCNEPFLKQFQLKNNGNNDIWYEYSCCSENKDN